jgi:hypothetical protein
MDCRCSFKAFEVILLHFKVDKMNWGGGGSFSLFKNLTGEHTLWKTQKLLEKPGNPGFPRKFSSRSDVELDLQLTFGTAASKTNSVIGEAVSFLAFSVIVITAGLGSFLSNAKSILKPLFSKANSCGMPTSERK